MDGSIEYQFTQELEAVVDRYRDQGITNAAAIGALEVLKFGLLKDAYDGAEEDELPT